MVTTSPSKAARLWKRTWVGALLSAALAGLLALSFGAAGGRVVFCAGAVLALLGVEEVARMGRFAEHELRAPLQVALFGQLVAAWEPGEPILAAPAALLVELARPLALGVAAFGAQRLATAAGLARPGAGLVAGALLAGLTLATRAGEAPGGGALAFWGASGLLCAFAVGKAQDEQGVRVELALVAGLAPWITFALPALTEVWKAFGPRGLLSLVLLSKVGDVFGYYVGSAIGKRHPFPRTSPGKTTAGCVASLVAGTLCGGILAATALLPAGPLGLAGGLLAGAFVNLAAQAGDLLESKAKRWAGVKDSGAWFGPSGGVLDLVDSLLLSVPAALFCWPFLFPST